MHSTMLATNVAKLHRISKRLLIQNTNKIKKTFISHTWLSELCLELVMCNNFPLDALTVTLRTAETL